MRANAHIFRPALTLTLLLAAAFPAIALSQSIPSPPSSQELSLQQYIAQLRAASEVLDGGDAAAIRTFRHTLPSEWDVHVDGQSMKVSTDWLAGALLVETEVPAGNPLRQGRLQQTKQKLAALREAAEQLAGPPLPADLERARGRIDRILRDREFQGSSEPTALDRLKERVLGWIRRQLDKIFGRFGVPARVGSAVAWTLIGLAALLLAFWCVRWLIAAASREDMDLRGARPAGQDWRHWAREANAAAARGEYRTAIHAAYWSAIARLEENRLLSPDRSRTPRESLRLVQRTNAVYKPMAKLTRRFELTWYGYRAATSADWDDAMQQLGTIECLPSSTATIARS